VALARLVCGAAAPRRALTVLRRCTRSHVERAFRAFGPFEGIFGGVVGRDPGVLFGLKLAGCSSEIDAVPELTVVHLDPSMRLVAHEARGEAERERGDHEGITAMPADTFLRERELGVEFDAALGGGERLGGLERPEVIDEPN